MSPGGKPSREPVEVVAGQVGDQPALVFAEGNLDRDQAFQVFGLHRRGANQ